MPRQIQGMKQKYFINLVLLHHSGSQACSIACRFVVNNLFSIYFKDMENKMRNTLNDIYFGKTKDIVNALRYAFYFCVRCNIYDPNCFHLSIAD